jgi:hypothetical protein
VPPRGRRGFRNYPELPVFLCDPKLGRIHRDFEGYSGYWLISDAMKSVLEATDKAAFAFLPCDMRSPDGKQCAVRWLCDVTRVVDALDEGKSTVGIGIADDGSKVYQIVGRQRLVFNEEAVGAFRIFRMRYHELVICDQQMRLACKSAALKGMSFESTE